MHFIQKFELLSMIFNLLNLKTCFIFLTWFNSIASIACYLGMCVLICVILLVCVNGGFGGQVVSALGFHLWGRRFKSQWELSQCDSNPVLMWKEQKSTLCRKSWVSSVYSGFLPQGKLTGWVRQKGPTVIGICCCGDPALVGKAK
jgi:hypothetical protein